MFQLVNIVGLTEYFFSRKLNSLLVSPVGLAGGALFVTCTDKYDSVALSSTDMTQWHLSSIDLMAHMLGARNNFADYYSTKLFLAKPRHGNHFSEMYRYSYDSK